MTAAQTHPCRPTPPAEPNCELSPENTPLCQQHLARGSRNDAVPADCFVLVKPLPLPLPLDLPTGCWNGERRSPLLSRGSATGWRSPKGGVSVTRATACAVPFAAYLARCLLSFTHALGLHLQGHGCRAGHLRNDKSTPGERRTCSVLKACPSRSSCSACMPTTQSRVIVSSVVRPLLPRDAGSTG